MKFKLNDVIKELVGNKVEALEYGTDSPEREEAIGKVIAKACIGINCGDTGIILMFDEMSESIFVFANEEITIS